MEILNHILPQHIKFMNVIPVGNGEDCSWLIAGTYRKSRKKDRCELHLYEYFFTKAFVDLKAFRRENRVVANVLGLQL